MTNYYLTKHPLVQRLNTQDARRERAQEYLASRPWIKPVVIGAGYGYGHRFERSVSTVDEWPDHRSAWRDMVRVAACIALGLGLLWASSYVRGI